MKKKFLFLFIILFQLSYSQVFKFPFDSSAFNTSFEKERFNSFARGEKCDFTGMMLSTDEGITDAIEKKYKGLLSGFYEKYDKKVLKEKEILKKVGVIFNGIHETFLIKYDTIVTFDKIFETGTYNCVTATALYGIAFDHYGIGFQIKETPMHVYIVADPADKGIRVESTNPLRGYYMPDDKFKKNYVEYLLNIKLIDKGELDKSGYKTIFDQYYNTDVSIAPCQLAALQYYNSGLENYTKKDYIKAIRQLEKAYFLYPSKDIRIMLLYSLQSEIKKGDYFDPKFALLLSKYFNYFEEKNMTLYTAIAGEFESMTGKILVEQNKQDYYNQVYKTISENISDTLLMKNISLIYHKLLARANYFEGYYELALDHIFNAYQLNPNNLEISSMLSSLIIEKGKNSNNPKKVITELDDYTAKYSSLKSNLIINKYYVICYLTAAESYFIENNTSNGNKFLTLFEAFMDANKVDFDQDIIGRAYGEAWRSYVRLKDRPTAYKYVNRGLKYAPFSKELLEKKRWIAEER